MKFIKWLFTIHWWYFLPEPIDLIYSLNKNPSSKSLLHCRVENSSCTVELSLLVQPHHRMLNSQLKGRFWGHFYDMRKHWWNNSVFFIPFLGIKVKILHRSCLQPLSTLNSSLSGIPLLPWFWGFLPVCCIDNWQSPGSQQIVCQSLDNFKEKGNAFPQLEILD